MRELEQRGNSSQQVALLQTQVRKMEQDAKISENARILAERSWATQDRQQSNIIKAENDRLKSEVVRLNQLLAEEREQSETYRTAMNNTQAELEALRGKLRTLLGT